MIMSLLTLLFATIIITATASSSPDVKPGCEEMCGNVRVPYPFGIGKKECALNPYFFLNCSSDQLWFGLNMPARSISVLNGTITVGTYVAYDCYDASGMRTDYSGSDWSISIGSGPFTFSDTRNKFVVISCNSFGWVTDPATTAGTACLALCSQPVTNLSAENCAGDGCCQTSIPKGLHKVFYSLQNLNNRTDVWDLNRCKYAFVAEASSINYSYWQLSTTPYVQNPDTVLDWVVENKTCQQATGDTSAYACGRNATCTDHGQGYRCVCSEGFRGNPYLPQGCVDIDECLEPENYPCKGKCKNKIGGYDCPCRFGMHGDGKTASCQLSRTSTIIAAVVPVIVFVIICVLLYMILNKKLKHKHFRENGGMVLKTQRIKIFKESELAKATNNYGDDRRLGEGGFGAVYKGVLTDSTQVAVKKSKEMDKAKIDEDFQREIDAVSTANQKNVVKLVGLCLETKVPLLVYEFIPNGSLFKHIHDKSSQVLASWGNRLRIAAESALALYYLHSLADPPVIHGDVKSANILIDTDYTAKVADFGASVFISPGEAKVVNKIQGTRGYLDPEYLSSGNLTEKSDVYSFGVVLLELLTRTTPNFTSKSGQTHNIIQCFFLAMENNELFSILDFQPTGEGERHEIEAVAQLAKRCVNSMGIYRPTMKEVSDELAKLRERHHQTDHLAGQVSYSFINNSSAPVSPEISIGIAMAE